MALEMEVNIERLMEMKIEKIKHPGRYDGQRQSPIKVKRRVKPYHTVLKNQSFGPIFGK
ncbi:hypothetical protein [Paenibacillus dendritiformis]|uniref:hypothetical protein n=1 Tax=Paenibacillus dendritiformis TaxID=130049 RepID=UPI001300C7FC|nr:hypothetical protein [Paenibacillus dendritiformis]CAH8771430.1 hypothetical protein H7S4_004165 [Paenibacillus dendritiformis]